MKQFLIAFQLRKSKRSRCAQSNQYILFEIAKRYHINLIVGNMYSHIFL